MKFKLPNNLNRIYQTQIILAILIVSFVYNAKLIGQCPTSISITSQADVNSFSTNHPDCVSQGWVENITINGSDISDLSGLNSITHVKSTLDWEDANVTSFSSWNTLDTIIKFQLRNTASTLTNFSGLENVDTIGNFDSHAPNVDDLSAFANCKINEFDFTSNSITTINGFNTTTSMQMIRIDNCPNLTSITGFQNLERLNQHLWLRHNNALTDISGFSQLSQVVFQVNINGGQLIDLADLTGLKLVGHLLIIQNLPNFNDLSALNQMYLLGSIQLLNNPELASCCTVTKLLKTGVLRDVAVIENNKTNCSNLFEIFNSCKDSDSDNIEDSIDNCVNSSNPSQSDYDIDGIGDGCDNCPLDYNPNQEDSNNNGIGDVCDNGNVNIGVYNEIGDLYNSSNVNGIILKSINGTCYRIIADNNGGLETHIVECP